MTTTTVAVAHAIPRTPIRRIAAQRPLTAFFALPFVPLFYLGVCAPTVTALLVNTSLGPMGAEAGWRGGAGPRRCHRGATRVPTRPRTAIGDDRGAPVAGR